MCTHEHIMSHLQKTAHGEGYLSSEASSVFFRGGLFTVGSVKNKNVLDADLHKEGQEEQCEAS